MEQKNGSSIALLEEPFEAPLFLRVHLTFISPGSEEISTFAPNMGFPSGNSTSLLPLIKSVT